VREWTLSLAVHGILVAAVFVGPLYWIDRIEVQPSNYTRLIATTAGWGSNARGSAAPGNLAADIRKLVVPKPVPAQVKLLLPVPEARPQTPLSMGGKVKAPQLISMVEPVYPPLLRRTRVQGDVVIDAVIDTEGNVLEEHTVSGIEFLVAAAMDALRRWKYEPTVLPGQVFPVYLRVTITFRLGQKG